MDYYHAQLVFKRKDREDLFEFDVNREYVLNEFVRPFLNGESFVFAGAPVQPSEIERIQVAKTDNPADLVAERLVANYRRNRVNVGKGMAKEWIVEKTADSVNVTREIFSEARSKGEQGVTERVPNIIQRAVSATSAGQRNQTVFIVHGHDAVLVQELELILRRWNIEPVILSEKPNRGMTLIEKVEANTSVAFAFVLLTPDDVGGKNEMSLHPRARQNVVWEWGYLVGKLGRDRVSCLFKEGVEIPSDLEGIMRINVKTSLKDNIEELRRELTEAGFELR